MYIFIYYQYLKSLYKIAAREHMKRYTGSIIGHLCSQRMLTLSLRIVVRYARHVSTHGRQ